MSGTSSRVADSTLRDRQRDLTRRLLIDAFAHVILRDGIHDISMQAVADEARCSPRTLYRYFPSRESLVTGLDDEVRTFFTSCLDRLPPDVRDDLVEFAERVPVLLDQRHDLVRAWVSTDPTSELRGFVSGHVRALVEAAVDRTAPSLSPAERARAVAGIRLIASSRTWVSLTEHLSAEDAAVTMGWIIRTLLADLAKGGGPRAD